MPVTLRPYQEKCIAAVEAARDRGVTRMLIVAATGTGKTTIFCELARACASAKKEPSSSPRTKRTSTENMVWNPAFPLRAALQAKLSR